MKTIIFILLIFLHLHCLGQIREYIFNFDTTKTGVIIDSNLQNNIWQIGEPQKQFFNTAFTLPNAIITDTINYYPNNNTSIFYITLPDVYWYGVNLEFRHKYQTDSTNDGGKIEVSGDNVNWVNIVNSSSLGFHYNYGIYNVQNNVTSLNGPGFSGETPDWKTSYVYWNYPQVDTLYLRFVFSSDNIQTNKDGWMIDSIRIWYDLGIGINEKNINGNLAIYPNPVDDIIKITYKDELKNLKSLQIFSLEGKLIENLNISNSISLKHLPTGYYILEIIDETNKKYFKQIIKK